MTEHISSIHGAPRLSVPLLCFPVRYGDDRRGFAGFRAFPALYGYEQADDIDLLEHNESEILELLQSWLFFGLLVEAFGGRRAHLTTAEFISETEAGNKYITTELLGKYFRYWQTTRLQDDREEVVAHAKEVDQCLSLANSAFRRVATQAAELDAGGKGEIAWTRRSAVLLSIATTAEWMVRARLAAIPASFSYSSANELESLSWLLPSVERVLLHAGWCTGEVTQLMRDCSTICLYYLSQIERKGTGKSHENCSAEGCKALQTDYTSYKLFHVDSDHGTCQCQLVGPSIEDVANVLARGNTPLVRAPSNEPYQLLELDRASPQIYVAISHVWSDGLGNPNQNRVHACTFRHIQHLVNELYRPEERPVPFWIDTMCIPPQENHTPKHKKQRKEGITRMAETYAQADKVLVPDRSLQSHNSRTELFEGLVEMMVRIRHASWTTRVWTLQEGRLGKYLYFQFKDRAIDVNLLEDSLKKEQNIHNTLGFLDRLTDEQIMSNESAVRLLKAFATLLQPSQAEVYAKLPPQEDPDEEEMRLDAIRVVQQRTELGRIARWPAFIKKYGLDTELSDADEHMASDMYVSRIDPIRGYGMSVIASIRGMYYQVRQEKGGTASAALLRDVCLGFRGRITSRLEDESVCLGILLGVKDLNPILDIDTIPWRWSKILRAKGYHSLVSRCHKMRMKALLSQLEANYVYNPTEGNAGRKVNAVPQAILFWNVPRLGELGWNWAPFSILHQSLEYSISSTSTYVPLTKHGLEIQFSGWLSSFTLIPYENTDNPNSQNTRNANDAILRIHTEHVGWRNSWKRVRFHQNDNTRRQGSLSPLISWVNGWQEVDKDGEKTKKSPIIGEMAILIEHASGADIAVMVQKYGMDGDVCLTRHVGLLEQVARDAPLGPRECELHVRGEWVNKGKWRVG